MKRFWSTGWLIVGLLVIIGITGCTLLQREDRDSPTSPAGDPAKLASYAQMSSGSQRVTIGGTPYQINLFVGNASAAYGDWQYVEINQQNVIGEQPGTGQVAVMLRNVELHLTGLSSVVTEVVVATKACHACEEFIEIGRYAVQDGAVKMPVAWADLVRCYGPKHYAVWLKVLGGQSGTGTLPAELTVTATVGNTGYRQTVAVQYGTVPAPQPVPVAAALCPAGFFEYAGSCWTQCAPTGSTCNAACAAGGVNYDVGKEGWFLGMADDAQRRTACDAVLDGVAAGPADPGPTQVLRDAALEYETCEWQQVIGWRGALYNPTGPRPWLSVAVGVCNTDVAGQPRVTVCPCTTL